jgi:hypothetical protein
MEKTRVTCEGQWLRVTGATLEVQTAIKSLPKRNRFEYEAGAFLVHASLRNDLYAILGS